MFNNIIYFIVVLLIFSINFPDKNPEISFSYCILMIITCWIIFLIFCRYGFRRLLFFLDSDRYGNRSPAGVYHSLVLRLSIMSIFLFCLDIYVFHLKYWLQRIPVLEYFSSIQGIAALLLFIIYLMTVWYFGYPSYKRIFQTNISRRSFIVSNFRLNVPVILPWFLLSLMFDIVILTSRAGITGILNKPWGELLLYALFLGVLAIFIPPFLQYWWGCRPLESSAAVKDIKSFLEHIRFKYRDIVSWPIFEGRMMTAGIMGLIPRFRYILVTDSLMEILTINELKAVMAHEVGHVKHRHMLFYLIFFLGLMIIMTGLFVFDFYPVLFEYFLSKLSIDIKSINMYYFLLYLPVLFFIVIYFRYVMGFFMRNFERQADLHSAVVMESPAPVISSLEKIAFLSGKSRDLPSWHHFSIKERVEYLWRIIKEPDLVLKHRRFIRTSLMIYLLCIGAVAYFLYFSNQKEMLQLKMTVGMIHEQLENNPEDVELLQALAMTYHETGDLENAVNTYERILLIDDKIPMVLNNLAWIFVTSGNDLRDPARALRLATEAVKLEENPIYLDTLAEAYYVNGFPQKAIEIIKKAISKGPKDMAYFRKQLEKFKQGAG